MVGKIGERNAGGCVDDLKAVARQKHDTGFPRQAEEEFNAKIALDEPGLDFRTIESSAHLLQVDECVVVDVVWLTRHGSPWFCTEFDNAAGLVLCAFL